MRKLPFIIFVLLNSVGAIAQDVRTLETKVADILARMPVYSQKEIALQMKQMTDIGEEGWKVVCDKIIEPGSGDDTRSRFLIETYSRYLSLDEFPDVKERWEQQCIKYAETSAGVNAKRFFFSQLKIIGGKKSSDFSLKYVTDDALGESAIAVIVLAGDKTAERYLAEKLKDKTVPTAIPIMNALAGIGSDIAVNEYISCYGKNDINTRAAALKALAASGHPGALKTLAGAAKSADYLWDPTGAVEAYLNYASNIGLKGSIRPMEKICKEIIKKSSYENGIQFKSYALSVLSERKEDRAIDLLLRTFTDSNLEYRKHALALAENISGEAATQKYLEELAKIDGKFAPDLIWMLGDRGDKIAIPDLKVLMNNEDKTIRLAAAEALTSLAGFEAAEDLIKYIHKFSNIDEQEKIFSIYSTIADPDRLNLIADAYSSSEEISKAFILMLLAEGGDYKYFDLILSETGSGSDLVRNAAYVSLKNVSGVMHITELLKLLERSVDSGEILQVQKALATSCNQIPEEESRADLLLKATENKELIEKVIPILPQVGGSLALNLVLDNFYGGNPSLREICFDALAGWKDYSASYALYDICQSDNDSYQRAAFEGYIRQVSQARITPEQKLLLLRKIMTLAASPDQEVSVLSNLSGIHTLPALMFTEKYFDNNVINQVAIRSAMEIALPGANSKTGLYGDNVRAILERIIGLIKGGESDYDIERIKGYLAEMPEDKGFIPMFNGLDLSGWQGLVENPVARSKMSSDELARKQIIADAKMKDNWSVRDGAIWFSGNGANLCSLKEYADFEMLVDWRITKKGDSGIYLRGTPQVQIWDTSRVEVGAQVGSGGLYNNSVNESHPLKVADNPIGDWNTFRIMMIGERVSVWLNGELVVDDVVMENYWDRSIPIFPEGAIELQAHGNELAFRDIYVREIDKKEYNLSNEEKIEGFEALFNGSNLENWLGNRGAYVVEDGMITVRPDEGSGGNLYTEGEYDNFIFRFEFKLSPGANNGLGIRAPLEGNAAYLGMELQILDNDAEIYANLQPYQYHGSVYGVIPARRGFLRPVGEWNSEEVIADGSRIRITLNGEVIVDGDISGPRDNGTMDHIDHPGLKREKGHIGFLGHGSVINFRNIRIKELDKENKDE